MTGDLSDRVCVVTGSTRGIGRAIVERFVAEGARVVINGRRQDDCDKLAAQVGGSVLPVAADVAQSDEVDRLMQRAVEEWGTVDVLVNNAGIAKDHFVTRITDDEWDQVLRTNLTGPFFAIRSVIPIMKQAQRGSIINVVSWAGLRGNVGQAAYSASKAGLHGLTLTCAKELAKFAIRVNSLAPMVPTDMTAEMTPENQAKSLKRIPMHRFGHLDEIAQGALFLASDRSSYTTGQVLNIDGGIHLT